MAATNKWSNSSDGVTAPAGRCVEVSPSNADELTEVSRGIYSGSGGTIVVVDELGNESVWRSVPAGVILPIRVKQIRTSSTGSPTESTTATGIIALS